METMPGMMDASHAMRDEKGMGNPAAPTEPSAILSPAMPRMQRFARGGKIKKDGIQVIEAEKGETVLPKNDMKKAEKLAMKHLEGMKDGAEAAAKKRSKSKAKKVKPMKKKSHPFKRSVVDHHSDGSHTVMHEHESDPSMNSSSGVPDMDGLMQNMQQNLGGAQASPQSLAEAAPAAPAAPSSAA